MEFIVENLANVSVKLEALAERQDRLERQQERTERQMKGIQKLLTEGAKQLIKQGAAQKRAEREMAEIRAALKDLATAQKRTDERFERWLERGRNGHNSKAR